MSCFTGLKAVQIFTGFTRRLVLTGESCTTLGNSNLNSAPGSASLQIKRFQHSQIWCNPFWNKKRWRPLISGTAQLLEIVASVPRPSSILASFEQLAQPPHLSHPSLWFSLKKTLLYLTFTLSTFAFNHFSLSLLKFSSLVLLDHQRLPPFPLTQAQHAHAHVKRVFLLLFIVDPWMCKALPPLLSMQLLLHCMQLPSPARTSAISPGEKMEPLLCLPACKCSTVWCTQQCKPPSRPKDDCRPRMQFKLVQQL